MTAVKVSGAAGGPPATRKTGSRRRRGRKRRRRNAGIHPAWTTATSARGPGASPASILGPERPKDPGPILLPGSRPARRAAPAAKRRTSTRRPLPPTAAAGGGGTHLPRIPRAHGHGRSGPVCQLWAPRPPLVGHRRAGRASGPAGQHLVAASSRRSALPSRAPSRRALSGTASFCKYSGGPPSAPGRAGGSVRCGPPQGGRAQPGAHGQRRPAERGPRGGAKLPGRAQAQAARTQDEGSGESCGPRASPHSRSGAALSRPRLGAGSGAGAEDPELNLRGWEPQAQPLALPETGERIPYKRLLAVFTSIPKRSRALGVVRCC